MPAPSRERNGSVVSTRLSPGWSTYDPRPPRRRPVARGNPPARARVFVGAGLHHGRDHAAGARRRVPGDDQRRLRAPAGGLMLHLSIYHDVEAIARAYAHSTRADIAAQVHVRLSARGEEVGYFAISPDEADALAAGLRSAAEEARRIDRIRAGIEIGKGA